jgi:hypothetical protein
MPKEQYFYVLVPIKAFLKQKQTQTTNTIHVG